MDNLQFLIEMWKQNKDNQLAEFQGQYAEKSNMSVVWKAYLFCKEFGQDLPVEFEERIEAYLLKKAKREVIKILDSPPTEPAFLARESIFSEMNRLIELQGHNVESAASKISEENTEHPYLEGRSEERIKRIYFEMKKEKGNIG